MKTIRMKKADWEKWDTALRSGEYEQAPDYLYSQGAFCCLGVLQHCLTGETVGDPDEEVPPVSWLAKHGIGFYTADGRSAQAPYLAALGRSAVEANDKIVPRDYDDDDDEHVVHQYDFTAIADAIEAAVEFTDA